MPFELLKLPENVHEDEISRYLSLKDLMNIVKVSKFFRKYYEKELAKRQVQFLLEAGVHGEEDFVKNLINLKPWLMLVPGDVVDYAGNAFVQVTLLQALWWAGDWFLIESVLNRLQELAKHSAQDIKNQYAGQALSQIKHWNEILSKNNDHKHLGQHYDLKPLIDALQTYVTYNTNNQNWNETKDEELWLKVGKVQAEVAVWVANQYCHPKRSFEDPSVFAEEKSLPRSLTFFKYTGTLTTHDTWFPLKLDSKLGHNFGIFRAERRPRWARRAVVDSFVDLAAVTALREVSIQKRLAILDKLQKQSTTETPPPSTTPSNVT